MISFEEARQIVLNSSFALHTEMIGLQDAIGRVLAADIVSDINMPPFHKSAMDGYACNNAQPGMVLEVIETIAAGSFPQKKPGSGQCSKIMTGAPIPENTEMVVQIEYCKTIKPNYIEITQLPSSPNISYKAEDVKTGEVVLTKGTLLQAHHIAILAAVGCSPVPVSEMPSVGILVTGNELVEPSQKPSLSQIRNSNAWQLMAQTSKLGIRSTYYGIAKDDDKITNELIEKALNENDILLITGGVSQGDFDMVPDALQKNRVKILFDSIAVQPGKPTTFGTKDKKRVFGLPGNPVSSFLQFELLVKPLIYKMMSHFEPEPEFLLPFSHDFSRKKSERKVFIPVRLLPDGNLAPLNYHGSGHIHALHGAFGFISFEPGKTSIKKGEYVHVRPI